MSTVLVTGASGFVGGHLLPELLDAGLRVRALVRDAPGRERVANRLTPDQRAGLEFANGDVTRPETLHDAVRGVDAVIHLVGIARDYSSGRELDQVNRAGTENVLAAMHEAGVRRLIHQGALGVSDDARLHYARSKARAEAAVQRSGLDWTILKPSLLWGERDGFFNILAGLVRVSPGVVTQPGSGSSRFQPLWVRDLARVVRLSLERSDTVGRIYELGGPRHWTYREILGEVLRATGRRRLVVPVPVPLVMLVARAAELVHLPFPVASDQLRQLRLDNTTGLDALPAGFGFQARDMSGGLGYLRHGKSRQEPRGSVSGRA